MINRRAFVIGSSSLALAACAERGTFAPTAAPVARSRQVYMATNATGPTLSERGTSLQWFDLSVSVPEGREIGTVPVTGPTAFGTESITALNGAPQLPPANQHPMILWIHGYNNTRAEAVYRHVQMAEDVGMEGPQISFVWPSAQVGSGYLYDRDSVLTSRRTLAGLIRDLRRMWSGRILIVAHSLGGFLAMEGLTRIAREGDPITRYIDGLVLLQPDIDPDVFAEQVRDIGALPQRALVILSREDRALTLSGRLAQTNQRVGNTPSSVPDAFDVVDLTGIRDAQSSHLVVLSSPTMLATLSEIYGRQTL